MVRFFSSSLTFSTHLSYVLRGTQKHVGWDKKLLKDGIEAALKDKEVESKLQVALGLTAYNTKFKLRVLATRAIASPSRTDDTPHFTARIFDAPGNGRYLGCIHAYPIGYSKQPSFYYPSQDRSPKWARREFVALRHRIERI
ncbi:hypothetical protein JR316_0001699 [Psilocybe cubensis]|nr:hypothetical protein JR316_0012513 [Psilocybe cubensis]XP_047752422.1 hypothetical protein JR316_0001699 [Psilocybe cubensis]KAH9475402.1 hypothetical protein JR316_0012513 [Psilocybe cubensis]KAH9484797.1 hypothetical protein JR316_0001699 [Psilocybe cubensis]